MAKNASLFTSMQHCLLDEVHVKITSSQGASTHHFYFLTFEEIDRNAICIFNQVLVRRSIYVNTERIDLVLIRFRQLGHNFSTSGDQLLLTVDHFRAEW